MFKTHRPSLVEGAPKAEIDKNYFISLLDGFIAMHMMALNEFGIVVDELDSTDYPTLAKVLFCVYMILVSILLINMMIAMLGKTYQDIVAQPNENLRQWARALLFVERLSLCQDRMASCDKYSNERLVGQTRARFYGSTWALTVSGHPLDIYSPIILCFNLQNLVKFISQKTINISESLKPYMRRTEEVWPV